jgi:peptide deformylase
VPPTGLDLSIVYYGDPRLTRPTRRVAAVTPDVVEKARAMFRVMYREGGIGLAAPQAGLTERLFVMNLAGEEGAGEERVILNPELLAMGADVEEATEGCLSFPGITGRVARPATVRFRYMDLDGAVHEVDATGLLARCVQHETDHLDGILMIERFTPTDRLGLKRKLKELAERVADGTAKALRHREAPAAL